MFEKLDIQPVILCGGTGTRLWPLSRKSYPKQFCELTGDTSLFRQTIDRVSRICAKKPIAIANEDYRFIVAEQMGDAGAATILEPHARNTAPAICLAALHVAAQNPDAVMLVLPSDHTIRDERAFASAVVKAGADIGSGRIVTFGIRPTHPATGYGYISCDASAEDSTLIRRFVEKPDLETAKRMLEDGGYLWNSGMFLMGAGAVLDAYRVHAPMVLEACRQAMESAREDADYVRPASEAFAKAPSISFDYAVMEAEGGAVVPVDMGWSDLGAWDAVWADRETDEAGVVAEGGAVALNCRDTLLKNTSEGMRLVGLGLHDIVAVSTGDAVLVAHKSHADKVGEVVKELEVREALEANETPRCHRPWGWYESLSRGDRFQVKRIAVKPGGRLSLQSHVHRSEHWVVVAGTARVTIGDDVKLLSENESVYVPLGEIHRLENPGKFELHLIEVQSGTYLGEDDIVRYEDIYDRVESHAA